jgi:hypothetical protein
MVRVVRVFRGSIRRVAAPQARKRVCDPGWTDSHFISERFMMRAPEWERRRTGAQDAGGLISS